MFIPKIPEYSGITDFSNIKLAVLIPTYKPTKLTKSLIDFILYYYPKADVILIDDCTPESAKNPTLYRYFKGLQVSRINFHMTKTATNSLKAGASNRGLEYIREKNLNPDVVIDLDDDVSIQPLTFIEMVKTLYMYKNIGGTCSIARVKNKNANILTRLQGLEYHGFNILRLSDNHFLSGPLIMHGMLSAFRYEAIAAVGGYSERHLIEDYDLTARLKNNGWQMLFSPKAVAITEVPDSFKGLWKQRVRWTVGGIGVIFNFIRTPRVIFQDLMAHILFLTLLSLIIASFIFNYDRTFYTMTLVLIFISTLQFVLSYMFQLIIMFDYPDADIWDWLLRVTIIPEFIYSNVLSLVLIGSYIYIIFDFFGRKVLSRVPILKFIYSGGQTLFNLVGFSKSWGTK